MKEGRSWVGGGGLSGLSQGLRVQLRHKLCASLGLSLGHRSGCNGIWGAREGSMKRVSEVTVPKSPGTTGHPLPGTTCLFGLGEEPRGEGA